MDLLAILKQLGVRENLTWGEYRGGLEDLMERTATKYLLILILITVLVIVIDAIGMSGLIPDPRFLLLASGLIFLTAGYWGWRGLALKKQFRLEREESDRALSGKTPVAVAAFTVKTLPGTLVVLLRFGGTENVHEYRITTESDLIGAISTYFVSSQDKYVIVGCRERGHLGTVQDLENFLRTDVLAWLAHRVGGKPLFPPPYLLEVLRILERKNTVPSPVPG